jgi:hypothetical protein
LCNPYCTGLCSSEFCMGHVTVSQNSNENGPGVHNSPWWPKLQFSNHSCDLHFYASLLSASRTNGEGSPVPRPDRQPTPEGRRIHLLSLTSRLCPPPVSLPLSLSLCLSHCHSLSLSSLPRHRLPLCLCLSISLSAPLSHSHSHTHTHTHTVTERHFSAA